MKPEKRKARAYKVADNPYTKALNRGKKDGLPLAQLLERVVVNYSKGWNIAVFDKTESMATKIN